MASYLTGRARTLTVSGNCGGTLYSQLKQVPSGPPPAPLVNATHQLVSIFDLDAPWGGGVSAREYSVSGTLGVIVEAVSLGGGSATGTVATGVNVLLPHTWGGDINGSYSITVPVREVVEITEGAAGSDGPGTTVWRFFEETVPGGVATAEISAGGASASASGTIVSAVEVGYQSYVYLYASADNTGNAADPRTMVGFAEASYSAAGGTASGFTYNKSETRATCTAGGTAARLDVTCSNDQITQANLELHVAPEKAYKLAGVVREWDVAHAGTVDFTIQRTGGSVGTVTATGGAFSDAYAQQSYDAQATLDGSIEELVMVSEWGTLSHRVSAAWLTSEDPDEQASSWRTQFRGWWFDSQTLGQDASFVLDAGTAVVVGGTLGGEWQAVSGGTVGSVPGSIHFESTGGGVLSRVYSPGSAPLSGYRYLQVNWSGPGTPTLRIGSKTWTQNSTLYDLCAPTNGTATTDQQDSRLPLPTTDGPMWGVTTAGSIVLEGLAAGTWFVDSLVLVRQEHSKVAFCPPLGLFYPAGDTSEYRRLLDGDTDGRRSLEQWDCTHETVSDTYSLVTLGTLVDAVNYYGQDVDGATWRHPGWHAGSASFGTIVGGTPPPIGDYLRNALPATYLFGAGALKPGTLDWAYGFGIDASGTPMGTAQCLGDQIGWYPGIGDVWGFAGTAGTVPGGGPLVCRSAHIRRGQAWGVVLGTDRLPYTGATVTVDQVLAGAFLDRGWGTADSRGEYASGTPFACGGSVHRIQVSCPPPQPSFQATIYNRHRLRACFAAIEPSEWITYDVSDSLRHVRAYEVGPRIWMDAGIGAPPNSWSTSVDTGVQGSAPCIRYDRTRPTQPIWMSYCQGSAVEVRYTLDEGRAWSVAGTITADGNHPCQFIGRDGLQRYFWRTSGSAIQGRVYDAFGSVLIDTFTAVASGVDDDAIAADEFVTGGGAWRAGLLYRSGGELVWVTSLDGTAFT